MISTCNEGKHSSLELKSDGYWYCSLCKQRVKEKGQKYISPLWIGNHINYTENSSFVPVTNGVPNPVIG